MVTLKCIKTGSQGNCYIYNHNNENIVIDCGVAWNKVLSNCDYNISSIKGVCLSHKHIDHSRYAHKYPIEVMCNDESVMLGGNMREMSYAVHKMGGMTITPVDLVHDCKCWGFLIEADGMTILHATDTSNIVMDGFVDAMVVECNYIQELLDWDLNDIYANRVPMTHFGLHKLMVLIELHPECKEVVLVHQSSTHCNRYAAINTLTKRFPNIKFYWGCNNKSYNLLK